MQTIGEILVKTREYFERCGVDGAKVEAEWLVAESLGKKRLDLYLEMDRPLAEAELASLRGLVKRRGRGEPLAYVLGTAAFRGLRLTVGPGVLIPRPETEMLVDKILERRESWPRGRVVDLGTGSGAIAISLAAEWAEARVLGIDQSREALELARGNAAAAGVRERISFRRGDWLAGLELRADVIVANPPYLTEGEWREAQREVRDHEPREALVAEDGGLRDLLRIVDSAYSYLDTGGMLALECGIGHGPELVEAAQRRGYAEAEAQPDDSGRTRFILAWKKAEDGASAG